MKTIWPGWREDDLSKRVEVSGLLLVIPRSAPQSGVELLELIAPLEQRCWANFDPFVTPLLIIDNWIFMS